MSAAAAVAATRARSLDIADVRSCPPLADQARIAAVASLDAVAVVSWIVVARLHPVIRLSPKNTALSRIRYLLGLAAARGWELSPVTTRASRSSPRYLLFIGQVSEDVTLLT